MGKWEQRKNTDGYDGTWGSQATLEKQVYDVETMPGEIMILAEVPML